MPALLKVFLAALVVSCAVALSAQPAHAAAGYMVCDGTFSASGTNIAQCTVPWRLVAGVDLVDTDKVVRCLKIGSTVSGSDLVATCNPFVGTGEFAPTSMAVGLTGWEGAMHCNGASCASFNVSGSVNQVRHPSAGVNFQLVSARTPVFVQPLLFGLVRIMDPELFVWAVVVLCFAAGVIAGQQR